MRAFFEHRASNADAHPSGAGPSGRFPANAIYPDIRSGRRPHTERERVEARDLRRREREEREARGAENFRRMRRIGDMGDVPFNERRARLHPTAVSSVSSVDSDGVGWGVPSRNNATVAD